MDLEAIPIGHLPEIHLSCGGLCPHARRSEEGEVQSLPVGAVKFCQNRHEPGADLRPKLRTFADGEGGARRGLAATQFNDQGGPPEPFAGAIEPVRLGGGDGCGLERLENAELEGAIRLLPFHHAPRGIPSENATTVEFFSVLAPRNLERPALPRRSAGAALQASILEKGAQLLFHRHTTRHAWRRSDIVAMEALVLRRPSCADILPMIAKF